MYNTLKITNRVVSGVDYTVFEAGNFTVAVDDAHPYTPPVMVNTEGTYVTLSMTCDMVLTVNLKSARDIDLVDLTGEVHAADYVANAVNAHTSAAR